MRWVGSLRKLLLGCSLGSLIIYIKPVLCRDLADLVDQAPRAAAEYAEGRIQRDFGILTL